MREVTISDDRTVIRIKFSKPLTKADIENLPFDINYSDKIKSSSNSTIKKLGIDPQDNTVLIITLESALPENSTVNVTYNGAGLSFEKVTNVVTSPNTTTNAKAKSAGNKLYPNPANNVVNVSTALSFDRLVIVNSYGSVVYQATFQASTSATVDVSHFAEGLYYLTCTAGDSSVLESTFIKK